MWFIRAFYFLLRFGWFAAEDCKKRGEGKPETFGFLGFTHFCNQTKNGMFVVGRVTIGGGKS